MFKEIIKPALILFIVCVVITGSLAYVNSVTKPIIDENNRIAEQEGLLKVIPEAESFSEPKSAQDLNDEGIETSETVSKLYEAKNDAHILGYVVEVIPKGYGGELKMFVGVDADKSITGIYVTSHNETPGLGAKAAEQPFIDQYLGAVPEGGFSVVKGSSRNDSEVEAVSGATISSRAITQGVNDAVALVDTLKGGN